MGLVLKVLCSDCKHYRNLADNVSLCRLDKVENLKNDGGLTILGIKEGYFLVVVTVKNFLSGGEIIPYTNAKCKWCGKPFYKNANKTCYCSEECRKNALREQKAEYQRRRRKLIKNGALISNENTELGTGFLGKERKEDFEEEHNALLKEMKILRIYKRRE